MDTKYYRILAFSRARNQEVDVSNTYMGSLLAVRPDEKLKDRLEKVKKAFPYLTNFSYNLEAWDK